MKVAKIASMQFLLASLLTQTRGMFSILLTWHCLKLRAYALVATSCHVTTIVIPLTTNLRLADFHGNYYLSADISKLNKDSVVVTPQITVIDKSRLIEKTSILPNYILDELANNIKLLLALS